MVVVLITVAVCCLLFILLLLRFLNRCNLFSSFISVNVVMDENSIVIFTGVSADFNTSVTSPLCGILILL